MGSSRTHLVAFRLPVDLVGELRRVCGGGSMTTTVVRLLWRGLGRGETEEALAELLKG